MNLTKKQEYELLASISARGEIPDKFTYLNGGWKLWDKTYTQRAQKGGKAYDERELLADHINSFVNVFAKPKGINLIDLGCGNGKPVIPIIEVLQREKIAVNYVPVDISSAMIDLAIKNLFEKFSDLSIKKLVIDFEKESLADALLDIKQQNNYPSFLVNLGNTLGNYINTSAVLTNFLESMTLDDYLVIGNGLANDYNTQKILVSYNKYDEENVTLPAKSLGIYDSGDKFNWVWNNAKNRVEGRIKLNTDKSVTLAGQNVNLEAGEELLVMRSNKYSESSLTKLLSDVGFRTELLTTTKNRNEIIAMVQPTRYSVV
ncbi:MAG: L-histidine N(alpha)-methyltransferase [Candidatus Saccharimonadales bacterium]